MKKTGLLMILGLALVLASVTTPKANAEVAVRVGVGVGVGVGPANSRRRLDGVSVLVVPVAPGHDSTVLRGTGKSCVDT